MTPRCRHVGSGRVARVLVACSIALLSAACPAAEPHGSRTATAPRQKTIVDHAVVPAGAHVCRECGIGACREHGGHLAACRDGLCSPHCPVRPSQHGYYRTEWRRWPGAGVVPVSAEDAATPVSPPPSQVPTADEESPSVPDAAADSAPTEPAVPDGEPSAEPATKPAPQRTPADKPEPITEPKPSPKPDPAPARDVKQPGPGLPTDPIPEDPTAPAGAVKPAPAGGEAAPGAAPPVPPTPPGEPPVPPAKKGDVDDLFDQSALPDEHVGEVVQAGAMRYPPQVGRSVASGEMPWKLQPAGRQRPADSARGR